MQIRSSTSRATDTQRIPPIARQRAQPWYQSTGISTWNVSMCMYLSHSPPFLVVGLALSVSLPLDEISVLFLFAVIDNSTQL